MKPHASTPPRSTLLPIGAAIALCLTVLSFAAFLAPADAGIWGGLMVGMAVTANQVIKQGAGKRARVPIAASTHIYEGTLVFVNASGYGADDTGSGANTFAGIAIEEKDNSSGSAGDKDAEVIEEGTFELTGSGFSQSDVGKDVYASDNFTITVKPGSDAVYIGTCEEFVSSTALKVKLDVTENLRDTSNTETLSGAKTLTVTDAKIQALDPGGAGRDVNLPAEGDSKGLEFVIVNTADAAEVLTVKDDGGSTIVTPAQNETAHLWCDGTSWFGSVGDAS